MIQQCLLLLKGVRGLKLLPPRLYRAWLQLVPLDVPSLLLLNNNKPGAKGEQVYRDLSFSEDIGIDAKRETRFTSEPSVLGWNQVIGWVPDVRVLR